MDFDLEEVRREFESNGITKELDALDHIKINSKRRKLLQSFAFAESHGHNPDVDKFTESIERIRKSMSCLKPLSNKKCCVFCKKNKESEQLYSTHVLKNEAGDVVCPILHEYRCPKCGATGKRAHTIKYCPHYDGLSPVDYILSTPRNGAGKLRVRSPEADCNKISW